MKQGASTGVLDEFLADICVGDEIVDKAGTHFTIDRFGRAKPTSGGNELPLKSLEGVTVSKSWAGGAVTTTKTAEAKAKAKIKAVVDDFYGNKGKPKANEEEQNIHAMCEGVDAASDQMLVDKLRERGYTVTCTKVVEKIVFEEVAL